MIGASGHATVLWVRISLAPPECPRACILQANSGAIEPSNSSDFSFEFWTPDRRSRLIILRTAYFSPNLWTPPIQYGSRNSSVSNYLEVQRKKVLRLLSDRRESPIYNSLGGFDFRHCSPVVAIYSTRMRGGYLRFQAQYLRRILVPLWEDVSLRLQGNRH